MKIDEETLMAFTDGELTEAERKEVERALAHDADLRAMLEEQQQLRRALTRHYDPVAQDEVPKRLLAILGASSPGGIPSLSAAREKRRPPLSLVQRYGAIAATFAVGILAGQFLPMPSDAPIETRNGALFAQAELAAALETRLTSSPASSATHIGLTFEDRQGRACRTFDSSGLSGLACRTDGDWQILLVSASQRQETQFRQAGSPLVLEAAKELMAGPPLDAEAERKAMETGWNISAARD